MFQGFDFILISEEYHLPNIQIKDLIDVGGGNLIKKTNNLKKKEEIIAIVRKPVE